MNSLSERYNVEVWTACMEQIAPLFKKATHVYIHTYTCLHVYIAHLIDSISILCWLASGMLVLSHAKEDSSNLSLTSIVRIPQN